MYRKTNFKKILKKLIRMSFLVFLTTAFIACSNTMNREQSNQDTEKKGQMEQIGKKLDQEKAELEASLNKAIDNFNNRIESYEKRLKETGETVDAKTQEAIDNLKKERDALQAQLDKIGDQTEENWEDFRKKADREAEALAKSMEDLFSEETSLKND
jgi:small-conductance mechanosensitive channel